MNLNVKARKKYIWGVLIVFGTLIAQPRVHN